MITHDLDQTLFTQEQQLVDASTSNPLATANPTQRKKIALGIGFGLMVLVILIIAALSQRAPAAAPSVMASPTPTPIERAANDYLDQLFLELQQQVTAADPSENILPFPPIEADIRIQPTTR